MGEPKPLFGASYAAYREDGHVCHQPAVGIDYDAGILVCAQHLKAYLSRKERQEEPVR